MNIRSYIARRYLFSRKSRHIINFISLISLAVVAFVTAAMITVMSAFSGIEDLVKALFSHFDAPLTIVPEQGKTFPDSLITDAWLDSMPGIAHYSRIIEEDAWLHYASNNTVATIKGVSPDYGQLVPLDSVMYIGAFRLSRDSFPLAVPGLGVRSELMIPAGDPVPSMLEINAPIRGRKLSRYRENAFTRRYVEVGGVFSANAELDIQYVFVPLSFAREVFGMPDEISAIELSCEEGVTPDQLRDALRSHLPGGLKMETRYDRNALIYQTNASEKWATFLILQFILVIACFNIIASLTMLIIEKRKDIFILESMGMTRQTIRGIFIFEGILINLAGALAGAVIGIGLCLAQQHFGLVRMTGAVVEYYPVILKPLDIAGIVFSVIATGSLFCFLLVRSLLRRFAWEQIAI